MTISTTLTPVYDISALRHNEFPLSETVTYLNHAGISPLPQRSKRTTQAAIESMAHNASKFFGAEGIPMLERFHHELKTYINAEHAGDICPVQSNSLAFNLIANAIDWHPGDNIIFCDVEFPANTYPWMALERQGVTCKVVPAQQGTLTVEALDAVVDQHTRLVAVSSLQFFTGGRANLTALGAYCRERGILFSVDAIQSIGHMPIDVQAMNIDILACGGQKSLMALTGIGFLYVRPDLAEQMHPALVAANSVEGWEHWLKYDMTLRQGALRFMTGTFNVPGIFAVVSSLALINELGVTNIDTHTTALASHFMDELDKRGHEIVTPRNPDLHGPIVTFRAAETSEATDQIVKYLAEHDIPTVKHLDAQGQAFLRLSLHCYNNKQDSERFFDIFSSAVQPL
ncbi:MAG: aminotransferase class V-fold PLP-dependent enzyme [Chloroflexi bacterium]|nr:aminotransferase class V-fold PLP-dependent enzyme [Chloroflexota bacterium]